MEVIPEIMNSMMYWRDEQSIANYADGSKNDTEQPSPFHPIGEKCRCHVCGCAEEVTRHSQQLNLFHRPIT